jgi:hypothetical protein
VTYLRKHIVSNFTGLGRKNLCLDLQKLDNMRRTYDMVVSKDQTISSIYRSRRLLKMKKINIQDEEKDGYSDIVDEMQVTIGFSSTFLIDA